MVNQNSANEKMLFFSLSTASICYGLYCKVIIVRCVVMNISNYASTLKEIEPSLPSQKNQSSCRKDCLRIIPAHFICGMPKTFYWKIYSKDWNCTLQKSKYRTGWQVAWLLSFPKFIQWCWIYFPQKLSHRIY